MTGKNVCKTLPDHLVERIIAMLPFPSIFQARCLSKSWNARFSPIAAQHGAAKKRVAMSFQKLVGESCRNWKTYCPVLISPNGDFVAYDKETGNWQKMRLLSFLPGDVLDSFYEVQMEGALLYSSHTPSDAHDGIFYVANVLTRTWKCLPPPPTTFCVIDSSKLVTDRFSDTYKLILFCQRTLYRPDFHFVQIYDSKSESWSSKKTVDADYQFEFIHNSVHLNGLLYTASCHNPPNIWAFNTAYGTLEELSLNASDWHDYVGAYDFCQLVVCNNNLFIITGDIEEGQFHRVLKIDVESLKLVKISDVPSSPAALNGASTGIVPFRDDCHIFFGSSDESCRQIMLAYNVKDDFWSCAFAPPAAGHNWYYNSIASFQPSFSPFLAV